jgi:DNA-binding PadR family transcriptional regulator
MSSSHGANDEQVRRKSKNFFRSGELHLVILALVAEVPRHGYELMTELQQRFGAAYRPSPGSVYPALNALQAEGLVLAQDDGDRRVYQLSPSGREALENRRVLLASIEARTGVRLADDGVDVLLAQLASTIRAGVQSVGLPAIREIVEDIQQHITALEQGEAAQDD